MYTLLNDVLILIELDVKKVAGDRFVRHNNAVDVEIITFKI